VGGDACIAALKRSGDNFFGLRLGGAAGDALSLSNCTSTPLSRTAKKEEESKASGQA
jgi:hypothetical protein